MLSWRDAWAAALYGPAGFYARGEAPAAHFRTSVHASPLYAAAVARLLVRVDERLGRPDPLDLVDVGAGRGELLAGVAAAVRAAGPGTGAAGAGAAGSRTGGAAGAAGAGSAAAGDGAAGSAAALGDRLRLTAVEVRPVPGVRTVADVAELAPVTGLLIANEWLDDVPLEVVVGGRLVLVDRAGTESAGGPPEAADRAWIERWWPTGDRVEVGLTRDTAWAAAVGRLVRGVAVAVDYGHEAPARPAGGTLTGFRAGAQVAPVPDGSCDLTAHVALDSVAAAGRVAGAGDTRLDDQRTVLMTLGVDGRRPPPELATTDPPAYLRALQRAGEAAELLDRNGLGRFSWLLQGVGIPVPGPPVASRARVRRAPAPPPG